MRQQQLDAIVLRQVRKMRVVTGASRAWEKMNRGVISTKNVT